MKRASFATLVLLAAILPGSVTARAAQPLPTVPGIVVPEGASGLEDFAAREVRRYLYLRAGALADVRSAVSATPGPAGLLVVARHDRPLVRELIVEPAARLALASLEPQEYWIKTLSVEGRWVWVVTGGDDLGTLYGAYAMAEQMGVRFYLHGDVVPDGRLGLPLPVMDQRGMPLFALRGIQPFHDFPEGPDWWRRDDYLAVMAQLPKLRMNFFGLHTYPEGGPNAEPTVWIGRAEDTDARGRVTASYPSSYQNTLRGNWGYAPRKTSDFSFGAGQLFETDGFGNDVMTGHCPGPSGEAAANEVFNRAAAVLRDAFAYARQLGVQTCLGTETPLTIPAAVQERLRAAGQNPKDAAVVRSLYEGMFRRAAAAIPLDYYWLWTPEHWTWQGTKDAEVWDTLGDIGLAVAAAKRVEAPFKLATCGWVLGPADDRAKFGRVLPPGVAVSCINRQVGMEPVDPAFREVQGRGKWAIPWLEDDPALTSPQLWVGRMRRDAADARRYGCDGLFGIHWRTRAVAPNVAALAGAAWDQDSWNQQPLLPREESLEPGASGGQFAVFADHPIAGTEEDAVYQTVRYNVAAYRLPAANGRCRVTLQFCEPHYREAGKRVFNVRLQGRTVIEALDIFARAGADQALDFTFEDVAVTNGWVLVEFTPVTEFPSIAGLQVDAGGRPWKINCGGPAWQDYLADWPPSPAADSDFAPSGDFYLDWANQSFGANVGPRIAAILSARDGRLPRPSEWLQGPGGIQPDSRPWDLVRREYDFVERLEMVADAVRGDGNEARFGYWLNTFQYLRAMARLRCTWADFNQAMQAARTAGTGESARAAAIEGALPLRVRLVEDLREVYAHLLATVSTPGELGTIANWEQHILPGLMDQPGAELAKLLQGELPAAARPEVGYRGPARVIVPAARSSFAPGEPLTLRVLVLAAQMPIEAVVRWRKMGDGGYRDLPLEHLGRGVFQAGFPMEATAGKDLEYYVEIAEVGGGKTRFPETAPTRNQTLIRMPLPH